MENASLRQPSWWQELHLPDLDPAAMGMIRCGDCRYHGKHQKTCGVADRRQEQHRKDERAVKGEFPKWRFSPEPDKWRRCEFGRNA